MGKITLDEFAQEMYNDVTTFRVIMYNHLKTLSDLDAKEEKQTYEEWMKDFLKSIEWQES